MGICGTDISCYLGKFPFLTTEIPGQARVEVLEVGTGVENVKPGDLCQLNHILIAGNAMPAIRTRETAAEFKVFGVMMDGVSVNNLLSIG